MTGLGLTGARGVSPNLALDELVRERRRAGVSVVHLGFGESRLPVFPPLAERLTAGATRNAYGPVQGDLAVRSAVAGYFTRRRIPTEPDQVVLAPGSKPLLAAVQMCVRGDTLLPLPCWNTYPPQAMLAGKSVLPVPIPDDCGGVPKPSALARTIRTARADGRDPRILVLALPDNPTGTLAPPAVVRELCELARAEDLLIVSDEIYRDLLHDPEQPVLSPAEAAPERTVVTTGLSKNLALGGWRIGAARFPSNALGAGLRDAVTSFASEVWSTLAGPMQEVAAYAFGEPAELRAYLARAARLHGALARAVHRIVTSAGADCRPPTAGFYVYPDFEPRRDALFRRGVTDSASLQHRLLAAHKIAVLGGHHHGDDPGGLRFRAATSMLYGDTAEEQLAALDSADPLALPHTARLLDALREGFAELCE
ncbi:pyridoxal phosphate-dependent aminotransferase [Streptomyces sp. NPDC001508]|uniref:pyridoxal phosphate-dependent aminotransferase n=1 Tax=Streptomyces sp. NPDC001508 TaxID=3154656 RepID=UPI00332423A4